MQRLVISTVGTSLLTNQIDREYEDGYYKRLRDTANCTSEEVKKYHEDVADIIEELKERAEEKLNSNDIDKIREASAELNGIYGLYTDQINQAEKDIHWLIASDTAQDKVTTEILKSFLTEQGLSISDYIPKGFSTISDEAFTQGIDELLNWFEDTIPGYQDSGYEIYFNLVGGFKAIQGFANTIGMFYADKITYIFEGSSELITIPRLPIKIDTKVIKPVEFTLMAQGAWINLEILEKVPETLLFIVDDKATLSTWGRLIWNRSKGDFLNGDLLEKLPYIKYETSFTKDYDSRKEKNERIKLQETLAKVSHLLIKSNGDTAPLKGDGGVLYEVYQNKGGIAHFRVTQGIRVSCTSSSGVLNLRRYGKEPEVNNNP
ncbi:putative CRISPR-associated protein [Anabaena cylindrica FACHB-243]|uniref:CRISPR-associated protein APE2256 n=1 Tax=Anabaena cylindrica (strain ATCC 27899 / PCC 7122) TaxID=272123 RepID=K9ZLC3_ANACC|nr:MULTISPECIES: putative CRISPR-associated protein [Anabaena]AFZ59584.1 CRISPR-associated protein APE2256 [Anabaena cylindrica PCC 7122]MBD2418751.1 putative CRISPR-associated protein [Anabaena cylindrica FACHB-243]MBY5281622.1 putative CRISPR-associated protein [Anabaena sp. CCAP 1446/1C]MBY5309148.1 putative CRISPR-associated protein [Anabaena sp. CCAP 1446/1C]MCM2406315.1 putative CRISPR-associated protein [Anabaena sp. CCAP 1446/1C]